MNECKNRLLSLLAAWLLSDTTQHTQFFFFLMQACCWRFKENHHSMYLWDFSVLFRWLCMCCIMCLIPIMCFYTYRACDERGNRKITRNAILLHVLTLRHCCILCRVVCMSLSCFMFDVSKKNVFAFTLWSYCYFSDLVYAEVTCWFVFLWPMYCLCFDVVWVFIFSLGMDQLKALKKQLCSC